MTLRIVCIALIGLGAVISEAFAQSPDLRLFSVAPVLQPGDTATVMIRLRHEDATLAPASGAGLRLVFDDRRLRFVDLTPSSMFGPDTLLLVKVLHDDAAVSFAITQRAGAGIRGDHILLSVRFTAIDIATIGSAELRLEDTMILLANGQLVEPGSDSESLDVAPAVVWPGDTNRDSQVDESDLLPIAMHFGRTGDRRPDQSMVFAPTAAPLWDDDGAAHADVNGDGVIDLADAQALASMPPRYASDSVLADIPLPIAAPGDRIQLDLAFSGSLMGVSARLRMPSGVAIAVPPDLDPWQDEHPILSHLHHDAGSGILGMAMSRVRDDDPLASGESRIRLILEAPEGIRLPTSVQLLAVSASSEDALNTDPEVLLSVVLLTSLDPPASDLPTRLELHPNSPNPFNPTTTIRYQVADAGRIRLSILDLTGRELAVLTQSHHDVGTHSLTFDATRFASGVYLCRLQSESAVRIRKITLIK